MKSFLTPFFALALGGNALAAEASTMRSLFSGWVGEGYIAEDETLVCTPAGKNLVTEQTFSNYILEFDFKLQPGGNNGLGIHYPGNGDNAYT